MGHPRHVASPNSGRLDEGHDAAHTCACAHTRLHPCTGSARRGRRDPGHAPRVCARTHTHVPSRVPCSGTGDPALHCRERPGEGWDTARAGGRASRRRTLAVTTDGLQATRTPHSPSLSGLRCPGRAVANGSLSFWPPLWCWGRGRPWLGGSSWGAGAGLRADAGPATPGAAEQARARWRCAPWLHLPTRVLGPVFCRARAAPAGLAAARVPTVALGYTPPLQASAGQADILAHASP